MGFGLTLLTGAVLCVCVCVCVSVSVCVTSSSKRKTKGKGKGGVLGFGLNLLVNHTPTGGIILGTKWGISSICLHVVDLGPFE